jgi:hypothetical protein
MPAMMGWGRFCSSFSYFWFVILSILLFGAPEDSSQQVKYRGANHHHLVESGCYHLHNGVLVALDE